jgi:hypothetical protein
VTSIFGDDDIKSFLEIVYGQLDFFLWENLKDNVYTPKPTSVQELKSSIRREMRMINPQMCASAIDNFKNSSCFVEFKIDNLKI